MITIALRANRMYTLWLAAFQLNAVNGHLANFFVPELAGKTYYTGYAWPVFFQIAIAIIGLIAHIRRSRKFGTYRSWARPWPRGEAALPT